MGDATAKSIFHGQLTTAGHIRGVGQSLPYATVFTHGTLRLEIYEPHDTDVRQAHSQDELYFVQSGSGWFTSISQRRRLNVGDAVFVPAGVVHRFEEFAENFLAWVAFWGYEGGEANGSDNPNYRKGEPWHWALKSGVRKIPADPTPRRTTILRHGTMSLEVYSPIEPHRLESHDQDKVCIIQHGIGSLVSSSTRIHFTPGDAFFVAAGTAHCFEEFSDGFTAWALSYGPKGGEGCPAD